MTCHVSCTCINHSDRKKLDHEIWSKLNQFHNSVNWKMPHTMSRTCKQTRSPATITSLVLIPWNKNEQTIKPNYATYGSRNKELWTPRINKLDTQLATSGRRMCSRCNKKPEQTLQTSLETPHGMEPHDLAPCNQTSTTSPKILMEFVGLQVSKAWNLVQVTIFIASSNKSGKWRNRRLSSQAKVNH